MIKNTYLSYVLTAVFIYLFIYLFIFLYIRFTDFQRKSLQSPGTFISECNWDRSQKALTNGKIVEEHLDM